MSQRVAIDTNGLRSRLRVTPVTHRPANYQPRAKVASTATAYHSRVVINDIAGAPPKNSSPARLLRSSPSIEDLIVYHHKPLARKTSSPRHAPQPTKVLARPYVQKPFTKKIKKNRFFGSLNQTKIVMAMAVCVFLAGMSVSLMGFKANHLASAQAIATNKKVDAVAATAVAPTDTPPADPSAPSTTPVTPQAAKTYTVAPDLARYITIPSIKVHARVLQVGVKTDGSLGTPANVFDAAWYTGSAKPGKAGASLIDGHVSSWTTNGVFYDIKKLVPGNEIQIEKGDGATLTYVVNKVAVFDVDKVDMPSLVRSIDESKSGLNLITCGGKYDRKSSEFTQRIAVYAVLRS